jgi:hypothetical protein
MTELNKDPNLLEDALCNALRRKDAPEGFTASVLARVAQQYSTVREVKRTSWPSIVSEPLVRWAAFATVSICLVIGGLHYRNVKREREGEAAKHQLMLALRIAGSKLQLAKEKVNEINTSRPEPHPQNRSPRSRS